MDDLRLTVSGIEFKVRKLIEDKRNLQEELSNSKSKIEELENQIETLNKQLRQQEEYTRADALASALLEHQDRGDLKANIDGLVEEIDKCIKLLNQ